ncbi:YpiF family protein [Falsibacillus pallidus]|uniref:YpiF family protein n=1 Tax=Falsibacillus pallidus TaxID=493781 RepID=UPI003D96F464
MNWNAKDVEVYLKEKKFVDTAVVPLIPISFGDDMKQAANQGEFIELLSLHLERQFKGRMMFMPAFSYLRDEKGNPKGRLGDLIDLESSLKESGFTYVFHLTSDPAWNTHEKDLNGAVVWLPSVPLEHMDEPYKHSIMEDQVNQLLKVIVQKWQDMG